jgi:hypothetical protein
LPKIIGLLGFYETSDRQPIPDKPAYYDNIGMSCIHIVILLLNAVAKYKIQLQKKHHYIIRANGVIIR